VPMVPLGGIAPKHAAKSDDMRETTTTRTANANRFSIINGAGGTHPYHLIPSRARGHSVTRDWRDGREV
jgi:hypothetical protein